MLVLLGWAGMNIFLFFGMRVWSFVPLCWLFWHTVFDFIYFWIFEVFVPKGQMGFNFAIFLNLRFLPHFACHLTFSSFLGTMWVVDLDDLFGYQSDHFCTFMLHWDACCIHTPDVVFGWVILYLLWFLLDLCFCFVNARIRVESILSNWDRLSEFTMFGLVTSLGFM